MISWFIWFQLQIAAAVIVVLFLRMAMVKLPKVYSYVLWILVFVRLLCPLTFESDFALMPSENEGTAWVTQNMNSRTHQTNQAQNEEKLNASGKHNSDKNINSAYMNNTERKTELSAENSGNTGISADANVIKSEENGIINGILSQTFFADSVNRMIIFIIWSAVAAAIIVYNGIALLRVYRQIKKAENIKDNIYICRGISAPFTLGFIHPAIYLPDGEEESEREYIICHEMVHIRRKDYIIKNIAFLLTALYWFNPFVWLAFYFLERDMEMSCDEKVIKLMGNGIKKQYSQSLLNFAGGKISSAMTPLTFGENSVKQRVKNVLAYKNAKKWTIAIGIIVIAAAVLILFTTQNDKNDGKLANNLNNTNNGENINNKDNTDLNSADTDFTDVSDTPAENISIENKAQFDEYYGAPDADGNYTFSAANTGYGTAFYAGIISNIINGASADYTSRYTDPVNAAKALLHLGAGSGEVVEKKQTATPEQEWFGEDSVPEWFLSMADTGAINYALVRYTFDDDGSQVDIPMEIIEEVCGIWAPVSGMRRDIYQLRQTYIGEVSCIEISRYGIYRLDSKGLSCIYLGYVAPNAGWYINDNILYFEADAGCTFESADYYPDVIAMLDMDSGIVDMETIKLNTKAVSVFPLSWMSVYGGFINLFGKSSMAYTMPLINVGTGPLADNKIPSDEQEIDTYGTTIRKQLLDNPGLTLCLSNRIMTETYGYLDLDGDGKAEKITLKADEEYKDLYEYMSLDNFILEAGDSSVKKFGETVYNDIWAVSLDGKEILIEIYEDGPSDDPITTFYAYREGKLQYAGEIPYYNLELTIEDGIINATIRKDVLQTDWIKTKWFMNDNGMIEMDEQEEYEFISLNDITLYKELPVHKTADASSETIILKPGTVHFVKTDGTFSWIYVEAENGMAGWMHSDGLNVDELNEIYTDVFGDTLILAD